MMVTGNGPISADVASAVIARQIWGNNPMKNKQRTWRKPLSKIASHCLLALTVLLMASGCAGTKPAATARLGEPFTIGIGQSAAITEEELVITFVKVIGDSRCPKDVVCIWSGVCSFEVNIAYRGKNYPLALKQPGLTDQAEDAFFDYGLTFRIDPYPSASEPVDLEDYQLTMTVSKS